MPEVCEVTLTSHILQHGLKGEKIVDVKTYNPYKNLKGLDLFKNALPLNVKNVKSKGKFMWFVFEKPNNPTKESNIYLMNGFGMEGIWSFEKPIHPIIKFIFEGGKEAWFGDSRHFGSLIFTDKRTELVQKILKLAPDALKDEVNLDGIKKYKKPIVKVLMDQNAVVSGIGNYLVAEILYMAKISPHQIASKMSDNQIKNIKHAIEYLTKICYQDNHTGYMIGLDKEQKKIKKKIYHPNIKLKEKTFQFKVYGIKKGLNPDGFKVKKEEIIKGRMTHWVLEVQEEIK